MVNTGFKVAEAVNFGYMDWYTVYRKSRKCQCGKPHVKFSASTFIQMDNYIRKNKSLFSSSCKKDVLATSSSPSSVVSPSLNSLECSLCGKSFSKTPHLNRHHQSVHEKKMANCSICHIELKFENLTRHMKTKHEDNSFECQECNQKFNRRCNLTRHINSVHKKLDMEKCTECAKLYSDKYKLRNHKCKGINGRQASMKTKGAQ